MQSHCTTIIKNTASGAVAALIAGDGTVMKRDNTTVDPDATTAISACCIVADGAVVEIESASAIALNSATPVSGGVSAGVGRAGRSLP